jgi:hypothetical protein
MKLKNTLLIFLFLSATSCRKDKVQETTPPSTADDVTKISGDFMLTGNAESTGAKSAAGCGRVSFLIS